MPKSKKKRIKPNLPNTTVNVAATNGNSLPSTSKPKKRPAKNPTSFPQPGRDLPKAIRDNFLILSGNVPNFRITMFLVELSNLPKGISEHDLRDLFRDLEVKTISLYCARDLYHPTSVAFIRFPSRPDTLAAIRHNTDTYRGKRIRICHAERLPQLEFTPKHSVMLKNLSRHVTEEGIIQELNVIKVKVQDVIRPAYHYAYVEFTENHKVFDSPLLSTLRRALKPFQIEVLPLYQSVPKSWINSFLCKRPAFKSVCGPELDEEEDAKENTSKRDESHEEFGGHNAHKMFVGNIPRDTLAEDVIDYFNNFGSVIDYAPLEKKSCLLRKSAILSFVDAKHAQNAYRLQPHFLEGSILDVHLMDGPPMQYSADSAVKILTVKTHSQYLTTDEIRHALENTVQTQKLEKEVTVMFQLRFDAFDDRANYHANIRTNRAENITRLIDVKYINDEAVTIVPFYDPTPPTKDEAQEKERISDSKYRMQKMDYLSSVTYEETLKEEMEMHSKQNRVLFGPFTSFFDDNSVQINNASVYTTVENFRDLFIKCGNIVDYRALLLTEDNTKICYIKFNTDLAADLACTYNQRMVNGKRILVHLARETPLVEQDRSVLVEQLNPATTVEQLYDAFSTVGMVKYVQKQSPISAVVCFKDNTGMQKAANVRTIPNSESIIVNPCCQEYNARFFINFSRLEEVVTNERMEAALKPRILPEFHQLALDSRNLEARNPPKDPRTILINEVFLARYQIPGFDQLSKPKQINALKMKCLDLYFTQREHFLRLNAREQEQILDEANNLRQGNYYYDEVIDPEPLPPEPKQVEELVVALDNNGPPSGQMGPLPQRDVGCPPPLQGPPQSAGGPSLLGEPPSWPSVIQPQLGLMMRAHMNGIAPAVGAPPEIHRMQHLKAALARIEKPVTTLEYNGPTSGQMGPLPGAMLPLEEVGYRRPLQGPPQSAGGISLLGEPPSWSPMVQPQQGLMMGSVMSVLGPTGDVPPEIRRMQQLKAAMAYNVGP